MDIQLKQSQFVDDRFSQSFGSNKRATFIVVKEAFYGNNKLGTVNRVNIFIESFDSNKEKIGGSFATSIIGIGDGAAGVFSEDSSLLGKVLSWDNMESCVIRLYEQ